MSRWYVLLVVGICCISTSAILVTLAGVHPTVSAFYRNFFAALIWLLLYPFTRPFRAASLKTNSVAVLEAANPRFGFLVRARRATFLLILLGFIFAIDLWSWHRCIIFLGAGPATLMGNLQVLVVSWLAVFFFRESLQKWFWPGCLLALLGIALLTLTRGIGHGVLPGVMYGLVTAFTYSFFLFLPMVGEGNELIPGREALGWLALHAFFSSVVGWWLIITALPHVSVAVASTLLLLQPVLTSIWGHIFLQQTLSSLQTVGIFLAVCGIRLATWRRE